MSEIKTWTKKEIDFLIKNYPNKGKNWCMKALNRREGQIRSKAYELNLKQNPNGEFRKDWTNRANQSKIGKKRPNHSIAMKKKYSEGMTQMTDWVKNNREIISIKAKERIAKNGHPKGMLGKKHTEEVKQKISKKSKEMWKNMSEEMKDQFAMRASLNSKNTTMNRLNASWKAGWRTIGDFEVYYRSAWEANYARYLQWLKENNQIKDWKHEPKTFWFEGIKRGCVSYLPDFWVQELNDDEAYHEVKGWMDDRSKTKIKRMAIYHPNVKLIVIDSKSYKEIAKKAKLFVSNWE